MIGNDELDMVTVEHFEDWVLAQDADRPIWHTDHSDGFAFSLWVWGSCLVGDYRREGTDMIASDLDAYRALVDILEGSILFDWLDHSEPDTYGEAQSIIKLGLHFADNLETAR